MQATAHFTPEAWIRDQAIEVDAEGPQEWDCTAYAVPNLIYLITQEAYGDVDFGIVDREDRFKSDPAAPEWVREWRGPFTIRITIEDGPADECEGAPDDIAEEKMRAAAEAFHGEGPYYIGNQE